MKIIKYLITLMLTICGIYACSSTKHMASDPNIGNIEIEIKVVTGKDSLVRTANNDVIGKIDKKGNIFDLGGNKIGKRKHTSSELIQQAGY